MDAGKRITDFDEFAALVGASAGYCRAVVVVKTQRDSHGLHAIAAKGVSQGSFSCVECVNSWGDGGAIMQCVPEGAGGSGVEFQYAYFLDVSIAQVGLYKLNPVHPELEGAWFQP